MKIRIKISVDLQELKSWSFFYSEEFSNSLKCLENG